MIYKKVMLKVFKFTLIIVTFFNVAKIIFAKELISGYYFSEPSTQKIQQDNFNNPGFIWVEHGRKLWNKGEFDSKNSCKSCHGDVSNMRGVVLEFPKVNLENKLINLEQQINFCRKKNFRTYNFDARHNN